MDVATMEKKAYELFQQANVVFADKTEVEIQIPDNTLTEEDIEKLNVISESCIRNFHNFQYRVDPNQHLVFIVIDADFFDAIF